MYKEENFPSVKKHDLNRGLNMFWDRISGLE